MRDFTHACRPSHLHADHHTCMVVSGLLHHSFPTSELGPPQSELVSLVGFYCTPKTYYHEGAFPLVVVHTLSCVCSVLTTLCFHTLDGVGRGTQASSVVQMLVNKGADCRLRCHWTDMNSLHYAAFFNVKSAVDTLLDVAPGEDFCYYGYHVYIIVVTFSVMGHLGLALPPILL